MMNDQQGPESGMKGIRSAGMVCAMLSCLAAGPATAQPAASGGVDVQLRVDDLVESYAASKTSLAFLIRDISFGYELSGTGRGALGPQKFSKPRQDVDNAITPGKEPRGIIIVKGSGDQPVLRIRMSGQKADIGVQGKFIRSDWSMLVEGKTVTIIAPAEGLGILPGVLNQIGAAINKEVRDQLTDVPAPGLDKLELRTNRTEGGDQVIIQGNKMGFTISYPRVAATYSAELKASP
jgi:hypothetical protein